MPFRRVPGRGVLWIAALLAVAAPLAARAQATSSDSVGPAAGTWGGEASIASGFGSLVRFQSPRWALLAGATVQSRTDTNNGSTQRYTTTSLRVGARRYGRSGLGVRPVIGAGIAVYDDFLNPGELGIYGELGAVYFISRHVSLGVVSELAAARADGGSRLSVTAARVVAGVFF